MSKQKKDRELVVHGAITSEAMVAYLNNELTVEERQQIDKLLAADPFAQEALEGLQAAQNKSAVSNSIDSINRKVRQQTGLRENKTIQLHWTQYAMAAAVLGIVVGVGYVMINFLSPKPGEVAQVTPPTMDTSTSLIQGEGSGMAETVTAIDTTGTGTVVLEQSALDTAPKSIRPDNNKDDKTFVVKQPIAQGTQTNGAPVNQQPSGNEKNAAFKSTAPPANTGAATPQPEKKKEEPGAKKEPQKIGEGKPIADNASGGDVRGKANDAEDKNANANVTVEEAKKSFNSGDYKKAAEQYDVILKGQPDNAEALYYGAMSDYFSNQLKKSEKGFDKVLKKGGSYAEGSKWYKANILLQKGKKEEAAKLLNELSNTSGSFKERAVKKLQEIQ